MSDSVKRILSHDCGAFWQFVKYGVIGVLSTIVQVIVECVIAATVLKCLTADDWAVRHLGFPCAELGEGENYIRAFRATGATAIAFFVSNPLCWILNRLFVFKPGKYVWYYELLFFVGVSGFAMFLAMVVKWVLIARFGLMTSIGFIIEIFVSFVFNFLIRKFIIFKG